MDPRCAHGFQILLRPPARTCQASPRTFLNTSFWRPLPRPGCTFTVQIRSCCTQFSGTSQGCREALESRPSRTLHSLVFGEEHGAEPCHGESAASVTSFEELASPETGLSALTYSTLTPRTSSTRDTPSSSRDAPGLRADHSSPGDRASGHKDTSAPWEEERQSRGAPRQTVHSTSSGRNGTRGHSS